MMETQNYWEESAAHAMPVKYESLDSRSCKDEIYRMDLGSGYCENNLNFTTASEDDEIYTKKKVSRQDPMSHRIIEKRRRDRMNNCLADLSRLIPAEYLKKGRGRVEKTEIIEMAIRHMKHLQETKISGVSTVQNHVEDSVDGMSHSPPASSATEHYRLGFQECLSETINFLIDVEGFFARDSLCVQLISHLTQHCDKILATSDRLGFPHPEIPSFNNSSFGQSSLPTNLQSDRSSSSGISSFGEPERPLQPIVPPVLLSDDSNHSNHSHTNLVEQALNKPPNYKFKSSIKQRFSAERRKSSSPTLDKPHGVPIFALHDAGAFYIPLTVEAALLRSQLTYVPDTGPDTVLHPVTISVNFSHHNQPIWNNHSPNDQQ